MQKWKQTWLIEDPGRDEVEKVQQTSPRQIFPKVQKTQFEHTPRISTRGNFLSYWSVDWCMTGLRINEIEKKNIGDIFLKIF